MTFIIVQTLVVAVAFALVIFALAELTRSHPKTKGTKLELWRKLQVAATVAVLLVLILQLVSLALNQPN